MIFTILALLVMLTVPAGVIWLTKHVPILKTVGAITVCYALGFCLSLLPIPYDKGLVQTVASVIIAISIPLILFGFDVGSVRRLAKETAVSFILVILSVMAVSCGAALIADSLGMSHAGAFAGMSTGLYIGGTPNLFAIGNALIGDANLISLANLADSLIGGIYIFFVFMVVAKVYRRVLGDRTGSKEDAPHPEETTEWDEYDYRLLPKDRKGISELIGAILLAVACFGVGVALELGINGSLDGSLFIMLAVTVLGIAISFIRPVRRVKGTYQVGQYLLLVFSLGLSMSIDFSAVIAAMLPTFAFFAGVQMCAILLHFLLCKLFHISGGTALITSIAGIYGPPFIAPAANAYGDRRLILPGIVCGTTGLVIGNLLGIGLGSLLTALLH